MRGGRGGRSVNNNRSAIAATDQAIRNPVINNPRRGANQYRAVGGGGDESVVGWSREHADQ